MPRATAGLRHAHTEVGVGIKHGVGYCAVYSEHRVSTRLANTLNTAECGGERRSPCPLERWLGDMIMSPASRARDTGRYGEIRGDAGRYGEMSGDMGRCGEIWGDVPLLG